MPLVISGAVYDPTGQARPDATIELWHADHHGHYDIEGYHFRSILPIDGKGAYQVETVMPGHYPDRVAQHVHYMVKAPGCKPLVTQLYFATDPVFKGDPDKNFNADPLVVTRELVRPVLLTGDPGTPTAAVTFELGAGEGLMPRHHALLAGAALAVSRSRRDADGAHRRLART